MFSQTHHRGMHGFSACCRRCTSSRCDAAGKPGKAGRDVVSIAVAAGVRPSAEAVETAQRHVLENQGLGATDGGAAQRAPVPVADQPPLRFQRPRSKA